MEVRLLPFIIACAVDYREPKLTLGEEQTIVVRVGEMVLWCFPPIHSFERTYDILRTTDHYGW